MTMGRAFSLAGYLFMKPRGGALTLLRSKKRFFFAMDELGQSLVYYKDEMDMVNKKEPIGEIPIEKAAFTTVEGSDKAFIVHVADRQIELEAANMESCQCWLSALSRRQCSTEHRKTSRASGSPFRRKRDRSRSLPEYDFPSYNKMNLLPPVPRKLSHDPSYESSHLALSVLEERLGEIDRGMENNWDDEIEEAEEVQVPPVPPWLDDWVSRWLQHDPHISNPDIRLEVNTSSPASPYNSLECSLSGSEESFDPSPLESSTNTRLAVTDELSQLRLISNQQKMRIHELSQEKKFLEQQNQLLRLKTEEWSESKQPMTSQNRFLNSEVVRLNKKCTHLESTIGQLKMELEELRDCLEMSKREYVFALTSAIRIPLHDNNSLEVMQLKLLGGNVHKHRITQLVNEARLVDPSLPTLHSLQCGIYVDVYGFRQQFADEALAIHYVATQLNEFYKARLDATLQHKKRWKHYLEENQSIELTAETRSLVRAGIPNSLRASVWRLLIHQQVQDIKEIYGKYYYRNLCSLPGGDAEKMFCSTHQKQINLDLLRTMPNNVHFMSANCKGVTQLQQVLRAFCLHNGSLGYCQGMNFLAATALLFVGPEDAFWFLVAMTEKYFDKSYFDGNLAGAQADQEVLKELLEWRHPSIARHLSSLDVDLATITLNWFLSLFFDAVPFHTLLRIWDCFMLEGPKILFRFSIVLLGHHEEDILSRSDTIGIMKVVKAAVRLCYDVDGLFKLAFEDLQGMPSRAQLRQKQMAYLEVLQEKLNKRAKLRNMLSSSCDSTFADDTHMHISDIFSSDIQQGISFVAAGNQSSGILGVVSADSGEMKRMDVEFECRICCVVAVRKDMLFVSLISGYIVAVHLEEDQASGTILWELKLPDAALRLSYVDGRLFAALASGTLTVLENVVEKSPTCLELYHVPLGAAPLTEVAVEGQLMWIATACKLVLIDTSSLSILSTVYVACSSAGGGAPFFEKITCLCRSPHGLFISTAHSSLIQLWNDGICSLLFDIAYDHKQRKPSLVDEDSAVHIVSLCYHEGILWTGTSDGYIIMYAVDDVPDNDEVRYCLKRYPSGRRLSPQASPGSTENRSQLCYIPTREEALGEEQLSRNEYPLDARRASRVSINIDQDTKKYSVCVSETNNNNNNEEGKLDRETRNPVRRRRSTAGRIPSSSSRVSKRLQKGVSADSAVSVFGSEHTDVEYRSPPLPFRGVIDPILRGSTGSSNLSMEYDDIFETYSDEDQSRHQLSINARRSCQPAASPSSLQVPPYRSPRPTLRRKDLTFDDPLLIAVQEDTTDQQSTTGSTTSEGVYASIGLTLVMKLKISDSAVRRIAVTRSGSASAVLSCAGGFGEDESLLLWKKDQSSGLWINDPIRNVVPSQPV